jgi:hypothetical protein
VPGRYAGDVASGRDDDALTWDGDDDPTLEVRTSAEETSAAGAGDELPEGWQAVGRGSEQLTPAAEAADRAATTADETPPPARASLGSAALLSLGILGGVYLLYAIGWLIGGLRLQGARAYLVTDVMYQGALWLAVLAPVVWFGTVFLLTTGAKPWMRFTWLVAGVVLLLPWPFVMIGAVGQ